MDPRAQSSDGRRRCSRKSTAHNRMPCPGVAGAWTSPNAQWRVWAARSRSSRRPAPAFQVTLPLAGAITQGLLFKIGGQVYAVPAAHVIEVLPIGHNVLARSPAPGTAPRARGRRFAPVPRCRSGLARRRRVPIGCRRRRPGGLGDLERAPFRRRGDRARNASPRRLPAHRPHPPRSHPARLAPSFGPSVKCASAHRHHPPATDIIARASSKMEHDVSRIFRDQDTIRRQYDFLRYVVPF